MRAHYPLMVERVGRDYEAITRRVSRDERSLYCGTADNHQYLLEPGAGSSLIVYCALAYACEEGGYYRKKEPLDYICGACDMLLRAMHPDGTIDFLATNFYTPATFEIQAICRAYRCFMTAFRGTEDEIRTRDRLLALMNRLGDGCLNGGFHTPNHRWVESGALMMLTNILHRPELMEKAKGYLSEGIDCDENGEFTERSVGCYNQVNVNSMMIMAEEGNLPELYGFVKKNLDLTFQYLDADGTLFTKNSRRQDSGDEKFYPGHSWYYLYLWAGYLFQNKTYLKFADEIYWASVRGGRGTPGALWLYILNPELKTWDVDLSQTAIPTAYHAFYPASGLLRVRKDEFTYTLIAGKPDFLYVKFGEAEMTARMCASFFAVAQFEPKSVEKTDAGYRMRFTGHGEYKGLFPEPPATSDWFQMDHSLRPVIHPCDLDFTVDLTDREDGFQMRIRVDNTPRVPFKLEFFVPAGTRVETNEAILDASPDASLTVKRGNVRLENLKTGCEVTIQGLFSEHMYHYNMRGSLPPRKGMFAIYATGFSPIDRVIDVRFSKRAFARAMDEKV